MSKGDVTALVVLAVSAVVVTFGCFVTYGMLREYGDVCGKSAAFEKNPSTYGVCGGYNSSAALPVSTPALTAP